MPEETADKLQPYLDAFAKAQADLPGGEAAQSLRAEAIEALKARGLPTCRDEAWKYTKLKLEGFAPASGSESEITPDALPTLPFPSHRLVMVNGRFRADFSDDGLGESMAAALPGLTEDLGRDFELSALPMVALNTAFFEDGILLKLSSTPEKPVHIVSISADDGQAPLFQPRHWIEIESGEATVVESHLALGGGGRYAGNAVTEIEVAKGARLNHITLQEESREAVHLSTTSVRVAAGGAYNSYILSEGAALSRNEIHLSLDGEGASCRLDGAYLQNGEQHVDTTSVVTHKVPGTTSREVVKGALDGKARGVFQGKIVVAPDAQQTDGRMMNKTLLLSDKAEIDTKPELEIYADDVQCAHGATAGELDSDGLFYLRSRGIPENKARRMMIESFLADTWQEVKGAELRELIAGRIAAWLEKEDDGR